MQSKQDSNNKQHQVTNRQMYAQLQQCGIDVYEAVNTIAVSDMPWLEKVCDLLSIDKSACVFDSQQAFFDTQSKQLHLPKLFYGSQSDLKKAIWRNIQQHV